MFLFDVWVYTVYALDDNYTFFLNGLKILIHQRTILSLFSIQIKYLRHTIMNQSFLFIKAPPKKNICQDILSPSPLNSQNVSCWFCTTLSKVSGSWSALPTGLESPTSHKASLANQQLQSTYSRRFQATIWLPLLTTDRRFVCPPPKIKMKSNLCFCLILFHII